MGPRRIFLLLIFLLTGCTSVLTTVQSVSSTALQSSAWFGCDSNHRSTALGINLSNLSWKSLENQNVISALSRVGWVRLQINWAWTEYTQGAYNWTDIDNGMAAAAAANINVLVILNGPVPCWSLPSGSACTAGQKLWIAPPTAAWVAFVSQAVSRYRNHVQYWEIWNEPNLITYLSVDDPTSRLTQYRDTILIPAAQAIHAIDPAAKVVAPVFGGSPYDDTASGQAQLNSDLSLVLGNSAGQLIDIVSIHNYSPNTPSPKVATIETTLGQLGLNPLPVWITEDGDGGDAQTTTAVQQSQSTFLGSGITAASLPGGPNKIFWFALTDSPDANYNPMNDFGLVNLQDYINFEWTPRPAYTTLNSVIDNACGIGGLANSSSVQLNSDGLSSAQ
jgi:polysaccharide biosynthesis protein PslG